MKNKELGPLLQRINACGNLSGVKFAYALSKNKKLIMREIEMLNEVIKQSEEYAKFEKKRVELCEKYAKKDEKGKPKIEKNEYLIANRKKFEKELEKLRADNKEPLDKREIQVKEFNELLENESSYVPFKIKLEDVPKEITASQLDGIKDLINDNELNLRE